jgi:hypothetical protein
MLIASVLLSSGCAPKVTVVLDPNVPHKIADEIEANVWGRLPDGRLAKQRVRVPAGYWVAGPPAVEGDK